MKGITKPGNSGVPFMAGSSVKGGDRTRAELLARVARMNKIGSERSARVLPETAALIPVEAQTPKNIGGGAVGAVGKIQPNPTANDFSQFVLLGQLGFQQSQNGVRRQFPVGVVRRFASAGL